MEISVATERILLFKDKISAPEAQSLAWDKKISAFDALSKVAGFFSRPSDDDFELIYSEHRFQPFWHVIARSNYIYDRTANYQIPASGSEVRTITYLKNDYTVTNGHIHLPFLEHCQTETQSEVLVDGVSGKDTPELSKYLQLDPLVVTGQFDKQIPKGSIIVPPETRVSSIMRNTLAKMIQGIEADKILEEKVEVTCIDLYYHPIFAFQYRWISKGKQGIIEVDGLTGDIRSGTRVFNEYLGKVLDQNFLFDLGADAAGMLIPGGSIAVKVAKKYLDIKKK